LAHVGVTCLLRVLTQLTDRPRGGPPDLKHQLLRAAWALKTPPGGGLRRATQIGDDVLLLSMGFLTCCPTNGCARDDARLAAALTFIAAYYPGPRWTPRP
jgi:hypothetical protein